MVRGRWGEVGEGGEEGGGPVCRLLLVPDVPKQLGGLLANVRAGTPGEFEGLVGLGAGLEQPGDVVVLPAGVEELPATGQRLAGRLIGLLGALPVGGPLPLAQPGRVAPRP